MNNKKLIPFLVWLIVKLDQHSWTVLKSEIDSAFQLENRRDVIPAGKQDDISEKIMTRL